mmetsp:Transcript_17453/g.26083  ORF Transcript_17453/g.26083 Transcript_17453/m.26083 type:complete len:539 (+) Transcript_17453:96-1712(+)
MKIIFSSYIIASLLIHTQKVAAFTPKTFSYTATNSAKNRRPTHRATGRLFQDQQSNENESNDGNEKKEVRLVLIGGGHAHLQVIKTFNKKSIPSNVKVTLIDKESFASYSGMAPGAIAKLYHPQETRIDLVGLSSWAGVEFIEDRVTSIDPTSQQIFLEEGKSHSHVQYDLLSIDIGSTSRGIGSIPGVKEFAIPTRPISRLISRIEKEEARITKQLEFSKYDKMKIHVIIIGAGVAGIELAMSIRGRWTELLRDHDFEVTLLNSGRGLLLDESAPCRDSLHRILKERKINIRHECKVDRINENMIELASGETIGYTHCIWATGAQPHSLAYELEQKGIGINENGWIKVSPTLQSLSHENIFAAGDCATIVSNDFQPPPKAGVYAVRSGPILVKNLSAYFKDAYESTSLIEYKPQNEFLKLIACGDGTAFGIRFGIPLEGKWVWQLKDTIDQMFMDLFRVKNLPDLSEDTGGQYDISQYDERSTRPELLEPGQAAKLLLKKDVQDFQRAWDVLRGMMDDEVYREEVQNCVATLQCSKI